MQRVTQEVTRLGIPQSNGQVSAVPDGRTLRYYATLGLLDRPAEVRGRRAYYGPRHLLQAVAVKALQAEGLPLQEIQHRLAGRSDEELRQLTARPAATRFWRTAPAAASAPAPAVAGAAPAGAAPAPAGLTAAPPAEPSPDPVAVRLAPGLTLVLDPRRAPAPADLDAIRTAADALVTTVRRLGLVAAPTEQEMP